MKVGILTFHDGLNHGAYLQAYCLCQAVRQLGHDPVIINYKNKQHWVKENVKPWLAYRRPVRFLDHWRKRRAFVRDNRQLPLTPYTRDPEMARQWHFDAVIVGSDTVWATNLFGFDPLYFGEVNADRRIAYAASCGSTHFEAPILVPIQAGLRRFDAISVRDENTRAMVTAATGATPEIVLDPVFLPERLDEACEPPSPTGNPFVLVYGDIYTPKDAQFIRSFAAERNLAVVSVGFRNLWADHAVLDVGPLHIPSYFRAADFVFSSTFHGAILAIRTERNFAVRIHRAIENKVTHLLGNLRLEIHAQSVLSEFGDAPIDYRSVRSQLGKERKDGLTFLRNALE